jgi:GNAT superfamily N-acetyltransferase
VDELDVGQKMKIRILTESEAKECFSVISELRTHLGLDEFMARIALQYKMGYFLVAVFDPDIVGVMGIRPVRTLARGWHLHVDDLVTTQDKRRSGIGSELLSFAEKYAKEEGMESIFLDSVPTALDFYSKHGFAPHTATLVRKKIK